MCMENNETENYDCLRECIINLENKNSGINSTISPSIFDIGIRRNNLDYVNTDFDNADFNFMEMENFLLQNAERLENNTKNERIRQGKVVDVISDSSENLDTVTWSYDIFTNFSSDSNKEYDVIPQDNVPISINKITEKDSNENKPHIFNKNLSIQYPEIARVTGNYDCPIKQNVSSRLNEITINKLKISDRDEQVSKCEQCLMTFKYKRHLDRHLAGHQKNNCPHCNEKFARRKHLQVHLFRSHGERIIRHPHLCDICPRSFPKRALLNHHRAKHKYQNGKVCPECGDMIKTDTDDKEHKDNHCKNRQFKCVQCSQTFTTEQTYSSHIQNHNNHKCPNCDVTFASKKKAYEHFRAVHSPKLNNSETSPCFCANCKRTFVKKDDYLRHLESSLHLSKVSRNIPIGTIFSCKICDKKLITQRALDQHIRRTHNVKKRFVCNIYGCKFQCARRTDLDRHKHLHIEERNIICEHCGKTFTSISILKDHVLYIHSKERQFICEKCHKAFKRNSLLKRHKLSHEQYRPFVCTQCDTAFKRSHHLTRHMETCHRITLEKKNKVVKLMKTEDGHLVPVPEKPKKPELKKVKTERKHVSVIRKRKTKHSAATSDEQMTSIGLELYIQPSEENPSYANLSIEFTNLPLNAIPQVLSLIDPNTGQELTIDFTNPESLPISDVTDQSKIDCNEVLHLPDYENIGFQDNFLNVDQVYYDSSDYSELPLENVEYSPALINNDIETIDCLSMDSLLSFNL